MNSPNTLISKQELLDHWQGHRRLTRRLIEAFPEDELFSFRIGNMRPFSKMLAELISIAAPGLQNIIEQTIKPFHEREDDWANKSELLKDWDKQTVLIDRYFPQIPSELFYENFNLFGVYNFPTIQNILYFIDNEIHHRGQGYVYLSALKITPPPFWER